MASITTPLPGWPNPPSAAAPGAPSPTVPTYQPYNPSSFGNADNYLSQAAGMTQQSVSPQSLDRSAARVRNRVDSATRANEMDIRDRYAGRGMLNSGASNLAQSRNRQAGMQAYGTGLAQVEDDYNTRLLSAADKMGTLGNYASNSAQARGQLGLDEFSATNKAAVDKQNADTSRFSAESGAALDAKNFAATLLQNFASYGNTFANPQMLQQILAALGMDISGLGFYQPSDGGRYGANPGDANTPGTQRPRGGGGIPTNVSPTVPPGQSI
jgi:hypothetical protein